MAIAVASQPRNGPILHRNSSVHAPKPVRLRSLTPLPAQSDAGCSDATNKLAVADLARSGLTLDQALREGMFPTDNASAVNPDFAVAPAIIIPYYDRNRRPLTYSRDGASRLFCRARYLVPPGFPVPRGRRYDQPGESGTPPYFPHTFDWSRIDKDIGACVVVEGEKKAVALCRNGIPTVGIGGVWNFSDGNAPLHPALADIATQSQAIYILFDSDAAHKTDIQGAEWRLAGQLALLGARVHVVRIPPSNELDNNSTPKKVGADDFLVKHGPDALLDLITSTPPLGGMRKSKIEGISVAELLSREVAPVEELIPGLVEKGIPTFIAGPGGVHKSRLALQWGLCLNGDASVWGLDTALPGLRAPSVAPNVTLVYCSAEDDENELARRSQAISSTLKLKTPPHGLFVARRGQDSALALMHEEGRTDLRPFYHSLINTLRSIPGHKLLVLDSAYDFVRFAGRAKIDEDSVNFFIKIVLQGLCDHTDSTILIPWHPSQAGSGREAMDGWSVAWHNAARARLAISAVDGAEDIYELKVVKRNHGPKGAPITLKYHEGALLPVEAVPDDGKLAHLGKLCVDSAIEAAKLNVPFNRQKVPPELLFKEAEKAIGRRPSKAAVRNALEQAVRSGELAYVSHTRHRAAGYYPPDSEMAAELARAAKRAARSNDDA